MSINAIPDAVFYDPQAWIDLAPDFDWDALAVLADTPGDYEVAYTTTY